MEWISFATGAIITAIAYTVFIYEKEEEIEHDEEGITVHTTSGRLVEISCQTCRKLKRHREVERDLYECTKCKRQLDLRRAS